MISEVFRNKPYNFLEFLRVYVGQKIQLMVNNTLMKGWYGGP